MGTWESDSFTLCGVHYVQKQDYSVKVDQREFTTKLSTAERNLPKNLHRLNGKNKLDATGLTTLRGINGSLQWFATDTRFDLRAKVSLSASETSNPTISSLQKANEIIRQAQTDEALPIHTHAIPGPTKLWCI